MLLPRLGALLLAASSVQALKNTSPFFLLSSEPLPSEVHLRSSQIALTKDVEDQLIETLKECDKSWYYIFSQEHVSADDFNNGAMPKMQKRVAGADKGMVVEIPEVSVMGQLSGQSVQERLENACRAKGKKGVESWPQGADEYRIIRMDLPGLLADPKTRAKAMRDTDDALEDTVASVLGKDHPSVLMYITTPPPPKSRQDGHAYEMDEPYPSALHTDLKRDLAMHARQSDSQDNMQAGLPLFEKYQFFTPGVFMSLMVSLLLFFILYIGMNVIAGLKVSYAAFSKEMGPQAQRSKQQ